MEVFNEKCYVANNIVGCMHEQELGGVESVRDKLAETDNYCYAVSESCSRISWLPKSSHALVRCASSLSLCQPIVEDTIITTQCCVNWQTEIN